MAGRTIAPRPPPAENPFAPITGDDDEASRAPNADQPGKHTRKKLSTACQTCQKKKVKCDGNQPCATCVRLDQPCVYARELDARVGAFKRKFHETQSDQDLLHALINTMQDANDERVAQLVSVIQSRAPLDEVKACITQQLAEIRASGRERGPEFVQLQDQVEQLQSRGEAQQRGSSRPEVLDFDHLIEMPVVGITASPWTTVTDDDRLVSHLVGVGFGSDHYWRYWFDETLFLRDMQSGSLESKFCSPMLVNCILAWACSSSDLEEARMSGVTASPLMTRLLGEAQALLEDYLATGEPLPLTALQGLAFLHPTLSFAGQHALGLHHMMLLLDSMQDTLKPAVATATTPTPTTRDEDAAAREMSESIDRLSWGVFITTTAVCACLDMVQRMEPPPRPKPQWGPVENALQAFDLPPYVEMLARPVLNKMRSLECEIAILQADVTKLRSSGRASIPRSLQEKRLLDIYNAILARVMQHPDYATITARSEWEVLVFRGRLQCAILQTFLPLRRPGDGSSGGVTEFGRARCLEAAMEIACIAKLFLDVRGPSRVQSALSGTVFWGLVVLLDEADGSRHAEQITNLCIYTRAMGRYWPMYMGLLQIIKAHAGRKKIRLPSQADKLFDEFEDPLWKQQDLKALCRLYPLLETDEDPYTADDGMAAAWKDLFAGTEKLTIGKSEPSS